MLSNAARARQGNHPPGAHRVQALVISEVAVDEGTVAGWRFQFQRWVDQLDKFGLKCLGSASKMSMHGLGACTASLRANGLD